MKLQNIFYSALVLAFACNSNPTTTASSSNEQESTIFSKIDAPIASISPSSEFIQFNNKDGNVIKTNKGSVVVIPKNAFVNADGSLVEGEVKISFKEVFTPSEIILSGIPMNAKNDGVVQPFISDGMFSIDAESEGNKVSLAADKSISVSVPSKREKEDFDFWYFDENIGEWKNTGKRKQTVAEDKVIEFASTINPEMTEKFQSSLAADIASVTTPIDQLKSIEEVNSLKKPMAPAKANDVDFVFNIAANYKQYPELESVKNIMWKPFEASESEISTLKTDMQTKGFDVSIVCEDEVNQIYKINYGSNSILARPVFIGADKEKAVKSYN
ncbi:MAG: hypothetical protein R2852_02840 [Bacteroidia bacterium]